MKRALLSGPLVKILVVIVVVVGFVIMVYSNSGFPAPRESDRVTVIDGSFSIIKPRDWDSRVAQGSENSDFTGAIEITSPKAIGLGERLLVQKRRQPPDIEKLKSTGFHAMSFQGSDAWVFGKRTKIDYIVTMDFMAQDGTWYRMELRLGREEDLRDSDWWPFMTSFKSRPKTTAPTSQ